MRQWTSIEHDSAGVNSVANSIFQVPRTSGLDAPIMELTGKTPSLNYLCRHADSMALLGHSGEVFATRFNPTAQHIASGSMDRSIRMSRLSHATTSNDS